MATTQNFRTLFTHNTAANGDTVEWCPIAPYQNYFVCGTYCCSPGLEPEGRRVRRGTIILFRVTREELKEVSRMGTSAILDLSWCPVLFNDTILLAAATGNGEVRAYNFSDGDLKFVSSLNMNKFNSEDFLILSIDWPKSDNSDLICCSDSDGYVSLIKFENDVLTRMTQWKAHNSEAWSACFDCFNSRVVYSGGDDSKLNVWDLRSAKPLKMESTEKHSSGVTAVSSHPYIENTVVSGSYDEKVLLWDTRNWKEPSQETNSHGGLWRLKWKPQEGSQHILAACIFAGFEVINPFAKECVGRYKEHESLAYGADWSRLEESTWFHRGQYLVSLCTFYDQKLSICLWDENNEVD